MNTHINFKQKLKTSNRIAILTMVVFMKRSEITRRQYSDRKQSEFSHKYACWANNHNGWSKMKKKNRRLFKKKFREETRKEIECVFQGRRM